MPIEKSKAEVEVESRFKQFPEEMEVEMPSPEPPMISPQPLIGLPAILHPEPPTPPPSETDDEMPRRRFTIGSVRELKNTRNIVDTGVVGLKPALKAPSRLSQNNAIVAHRKQTTFSPTLTLISETEDYNKPIVRTASLGTSSVSDDGQVNLSEVARIVRRRLSVIREQQDATPPSVAEAPQSQIITNSTATITTTPTNTILTVTTTATINNPNPGCEAIFGGGCNTRSALIDEGSSSNGSYDDVWKELSPNKKMDETQTPRQNQTRTSARRQPPGIDANAAFRPGRPV